MMDGAIPTKAGHGHQTSLWAEGPAAECREYLSSQLLTYIGNKRALLTDIGQAVDRVKRRLRKDRLKIFDAFAGSGVVSQFFRAQLRPPGEQRFRGLRGGRRPLLPADNRGTVNFARLGRVVNQLNAQDTKRGVSRGIHRGALRAAGRGPYRGGRSVLLHPRQRPAIGQLSANAGRRRTADLRDLLLGPLLERGVDPRQHGRRVQGILRPPHGPRPVWGQQRRRPVADSRSHPALAPGAEPVRMPDRGMATRREPGCPQGVRFGPGLHRPAL